MKNSRNFFWTYSGHEKIMNKFWTNKTGQILDIKNSQQNNYTNSEHFQCLENVPENDRRSVFRTNSGLGQIPDDFWTNYNVQKCSFSGSLSGQWKCPEFLQLVFWTNSRQIPDTLFS